MKNARSRNVRCCVVHGSLLTKEKPICVHILYCDVSSPPGPRNIIALPSTVLPLNDTPRSARPTRPSLELAHFSLLFLAQLLTVWTRETRTANLLTRLCSRAEHTQKPGSPTTQYCHRCNCTVLWSGHHNRHGQYPRK